MAAPIPRVPPVTNTTRPDIRGRPVAVGHPSDSATILLSGTVDGDGSRLVSTVIFSSSQ
jgi:hypothetical protein